MAIRGFILKVVLLSASVSISVGQGETGDPCSIATKLDGQRREVSQTVPGSNPALCDSDLLEGWYRFTLAGQPAQIPTQCLKIEYTTTLRVVKLKDSVRTNKLSLLYLNGPWLKYRRPSLYSAENNNLCGTELPYWLDLGEGGSLPGPGSYANGSYCTSFDVLGTVDCCVLRLPAQVYNCDNNDYVYYLQRTDRCPVGYCVYDPGQALDPMYTTQRGKNASDLTALGPSPASTTVAGGLPGKTSILPTRLLSELKSPAPSATPIPSSGATSDVTPAANISGQTTLQTFGNVTADTPVTISAERSSGISSAVDGTPSAGGTAQQVNETKLTQAPNIEGTTLPTAGRSVPGLDGNQTSRLAQSTALSPTSSPTSDQDLDLSAASSVEKEIPVNNDTVTGVTQGVKGTTVGVFPTPSQTTGLSQGQKSSKSPVSSSTVINSGSSKTPVVLSRGATHGALITSIPASSVRVTNPKQSTPQGSGPTNARMSTRKQPGTPATPTAATTSAQTAQEQQTTKQPSGSSDTVKQSPASPAEAQTQSPAPKPAPTVIIETENVSTSETLKPSEKLTTPLPVKKGGEADQSIIAQESILLITTGKRITTEGVRTALVKSIVHRCRVGLNKASEAVRQVYMKYSLCEGLRRRKRQAVSGGGLNPVITGPYLKSGEYFTHLALIKSNSTSASVVDKDDLLTLLQDDEVKDMFLSELGITEAKACRNKEECTTIVNNNIESNQTHLKEMSVFESHSTLFIILIVVASLCLVIAMALLTMRFRPSNRGSTTFKNDYNSIQRSKLKRKGKNSGAIENPATDAEIMKDEGEMREKDDILTSVNGSGLHGNYPDDDNGWVVPYDQLTMEERALPGVADTKL